MNGKNKKMKIQKMLFLALVAGIFVGCAPENPPAKMPPKSATTDATPREKVELSAENFAGKIIIDGAKMEIQNQKIVVPVFLEKAKNLDTVSLKMALPDSLKLDRVLTDAGFSAEIEGASSKNPVIYFHGNSPEKVISAGKNPIFLMIFSGKKSGEIAFRGGFFFRDATLKKTNRGVFLLKKTKK